MNGHINLQNHKRCTRLSSDPPSSQRIWERMETTGKYIQPNLLNTVTFIVVETIGVPAEHTHYILLATLIFQKCSVDKIFFVFFSHAFPNFKTRPVSPDFRNEADWLKMRRATNLGLFVGQPTSILYYDPRTPATKVAMRRNSQSD